MRILICSDSHGKRPKNMIRRPRPTLPTIFFSSGTGCGDFELFCRRFPVFRPKRCAVTATISGGRRTNVFWNLTAQKNFPNPRTPVRRQEGPQSAGPGSAALRRGHCSLRAHAQGVFSGRGGPSPLQSGEHRRRGAFVLRIAGTARGKGGFSPYQRPLNLRERLTDLILRCKIMV